MKKTQTKTQPTEEKVKRPYEKPELKKFGNVTQLTLQNGSGGCGEC